MSAEPIHLLGLPKKHKLDQKHLEDVVITDPILYEVLMWDGLKWVNQNHFHTFPVGQMLGDAEVSTSSESWENLITIPSVDQIKYRTYRMDFCCNVRPIGTLLTQGVQFGYFVGGTLLRYIDYTDNAQMYRVFNWYFQYMAWAPVGTVDLEIRWRVMNALYPCYSKMRMFSYMGLFTMPL